MLIHVCCSVDSHFFIEMLQKDYPEEKFIAFFYDPNIHPYSEYLLRLKDAQYSCDLLGIELIEGEYDINSWLQKVKGLENEPEKGDRCTVCFDDRLEKTAILANKIGESTFTTTLLVSPKKSQEKLEKIGIELGFKFGLQFIFKDYRSKNGSALQSLSVSKNNLYRQDYCGCLFALSAQRESQDRLLDELMSPITKQVLPNSIESRLEFFDKRNQKSIFFKEQFQNYRLLNAKVSQNNIVLPSYFLWFSEIQRKSTKCKVVAEKNNIFYANKDGVKFISINTFNQLNESNFRDTKELYFSKLEIQQEISLRQKIDKMQNSCGAIIVLDNVNFESYEIFLDAKIFTDFMILNLENE